MDHGKRRIFNGLRSAIKTPENALPAVKKV